VEEALAHLFSTNTSLLIERSGPFDVSRLPEALSNCIHSMTVMFDEGMSVLPLSLYFSFHSTLLAVY